MIDTSHDLNLFEDVCPLLSQPRSRMEMIAREEVKGKTPPGIYKDAGDDGRE
jgi:hypothetical protein